MQKDNIKVRQKTAHSYEASVMIDGKRIYKNAKTASEAKQKLKEAIEKCKKGETVTRTSRLNVALAAYLQDIKRSKVKATTFDRAESIFEYHIKDEKLGRMQIGIITARDIQEHLTAQCKLGLSVSSIKKIYNLLGEFFRYATATRAILCNPMALVEMPHPSNFQHDTKDIEVLTVDEMLRVIEVAEHIGENGKPDYRYGEAIVLLLLTGLRSGELRGLSLNDISLSDKVMHIHQNIVYAKDREKGGIQYIVGDVKTKKSNRNVPLNDRALLAIQRMMETTYNKDTGYLVCTATGKIVTHSHLSRCYSAILKRAGVRHMGLHSTRHTFATVVLKDAEDKGQIKEVSELLGHAQVSTTYEYYIKSSDDDKRKLVKQIDRLLRVG
jgi:integrase